MRSALATRFLLSRDFCLMTLPPREDHLRGHDFDPIDTRQVHPKTPAQLSLNVKVWLVLPPRLGDPPLGSLDLLRRRRRLLACHLSIRQYRQVTLQLLITHCQFLLPEVIAIHYLPQFEQYVVAPVPFQAARHFLLAGLNPSVPQLRQHCGVSFSIQDGPNDSPFPLPRSHR